jgi:hypothetical protein
VSGQIGCETSECCKTGTLNSREEVTRQVDIERRVFAMRWR